MIFCSGGRWPSFEAREQRQESRSEEMAQAEPPMHSAAPCFGLELKEQLPDPLHFGQDPADFILVIAALRTWQKPDPIDVDSMAINDGPSPVFGLMTPKCLCAGAEETGRLHDADKLHLAKHSPD